MTDPISIVALGIIEGVTEFLPISSTGHLLLAEHWLPRQSDLFNVVIQSGAVLAVLMIFAGKLKNLLMNSSKPENREYLFYLAASFFVTGAGGLVIKKMHIKLPENITPVALATLIGGVLFLIIEKSLKNRVQNKPLTLNIALVIGLAQLLAAVFPGSSRSGVTILAAMAFGVSRGLSTEFSFLLGIPTLFAASALQIYGAMKEVKMNPAAAAIDWTSIALGTVVSTIVAFITVKWLLKYVQTHNFNAFAWYRIVLGIGMLTYAFG